MIALTESKTKSLVRGALIVALLVASSLLAGTVRAEIVEEIMAWVNGEIITKSDYDEEEQMRIAEAYRRFSGDELDKWVEQTREALLLQMIDNKILVHHAKALGYDVDKMGENFYEAFKEQQEVENDEEFERMLEQDGMTVAGLKKRLIELYAPEEVIRFEVTSRMSISESEIETYYNEHPEDFSVPAEVMIREIVLKAGTEQLKSERRGEAEELRRRIVEGEDFSEIATASSDAGTREMGGLLGPVKREDLYEELAEAAFSLPVGSVSEIMEVEHGFHFIRIESRVEEHLEPLDKLREQLRRYLENVKYRDDLNTFMSKARADSEWCVKPKFKDLLSIPVESDCESL